MAEGTYSVIYRNVVIGKGGVIRDSIIMRNSIVGEDVVMDKAIVAEGCGDRQPCDPRIWRGGRECVQTFRICFRYCYRGEKSVIPSNVKNWKKHSCFRRDNAGGLSGWSSCRRTGDQSKGW